MARIADTEYPEIDEQLPRGLKLKAGGRRSEAPHVQAAFDFLPQEMRHRLRFKDVLQAGRADLRNQSRLVDRQIVGIGSRIAAARLREILRPAHEQPAHEHPDNEHPDHESALQGIGMNGPACDAAMTESLDLGAMTTPTGLISQGASHVAELARQREILREIGTAVFYFRAEEETPPEMVQAQRLHPRPLPARYYGAPPQQAGGNAAPAVGSTCEPVRVSGEWASPPARRIA